MTRTEMIDNLLDSYTTRELKALATRLGISVADYSKWSGGSHSYRLYLADLKDVISDILFDPGGSYHEFNKLAEANDGK